MGYKCSFLDNEIYGADDVSAVFSSLVTNGVVLYPEAGTVQEALNEMTTEVVSSGVSERGRLSVSLTNSGAKVGQGTAFFNSGVSITVDSDGMEVAYNKGSSVYVYFIYMPELNTVLLKADSEISEGDTVPLAFIDVNGKVSDMRKYAKAKVALNTANVYHDITISHQCYTHDVNTVYPGSQTVYKMPHKEFGYLLLMDAKLEQLQYLPSANMIDLNNTGRQAFILNKKIGSPLLYVEKNEDELILTSVYNVGGNYPHTINLKLV